MTGSFIAALLTIKTFHSKREIAQIHVYTGKNTNVFGGYMHRSYVIHIINSYVHLAKVGNGPLPCVCYTPHIRIWIFYPELIFYKIIR